MEQDLRSGRPRPAKLAMLESLKGKDAKEYVNGSHYPVLTDAKNVKILSEWNGDHNSITRISNGRFQHLDHDKKTKIMR